MLAIILAVIGLAFWLQLLPPGFRIWLLFGGIATTLAMGGVHAWYDERLTYLRHWISLHEFLSYGNLIDVGAELFASLVIWQIAPAVLLFHAAIQGSRHYH